jgi:hypothetical protein|tara:strand:- start:196 stop:393 length:198 start_codon:yes stop_codon:yes gene_type:complete
MKLYVNKEEYQKEVSSQKEMSLSDTMREMLGMAAHTSEIATSKEEKITKTTDDVINFILGENKLK